MRRSRIRWLATTTLLASLTVFEAVGTAAAAPYLPEDREPIEEPAPSDNGASTPQGQVSINVLSRLLGITSPETRTPTWYAKYRDLAYAQTFDQVLERATRDYVSQAYTQIFKYRNDSRFSPVHKTGVAFNEQVFTNVWNAVKGTAPTLVLPDGQRVNAENIWAYVAEQAPVFGARRRASVPTPEQCLGAVGPRCNGTPMGTPTPARVGTFQRMDGMWMHYIEMAVNVGSILHDKSCSESSTSVYVVYCAEDWRSDRAEQQISSCPNCRGVAEWRKAWWNTQDNRYWIHGFGPYPTDATTAAVFTDDTRIVANRYTEVPSTGSSFVPYTKGEYAGTKVLFARNGTALDQSDRAFCATEWFSELHTPFFGPSPYGICGTR